MRDCAIDFAAFSFQRSLSAMIQRTLLDCPRRSIIHAAQLSAPLNCPARDYHRHQARFQYLDNIIEEFRPLTLA
jgi:hypothetical protein